MYIVLAIVVAVLLLVVFSYNSLVRAKNTVENAFSDIDVQLKNRFDVVENLVNTVKWYAEHEKSLLENITKSRTAYMNAKDDNEKIKADNMLSSTLKSLFAVAENYPDLKANQNFLDLQNKLYDLENKIAASRRYYNSAVREYENKRETFPSNIIANLFGFKEKLYFELNSEEERQTPKVKF